MIFKNAVSTYLGGSKTANWPFSQFNNFAETAVLPSTAVGVVSVIRLSKYLMREVPNEHPNIVAKHKPPQRKDLQVNNGVMPNK